MEGTPEFRCGHHLSKLMNAKFKYRHPNFQIYRSILTTLPSSQRYIIHQTKKLDRVSAHCLSIQVMLLQIQIHGEPYRWQHIYNIKHNLK